MDPAVFHSCLIM